jgi:hypothetical protein
MCLVEDKVCVEKQAIFFAQPEQRALHLLPSREDHMLVWRSSYIACQKLDCQQLFEHKFICCGPDSGASKCGLAWRGPNM